MEPKIVTIDEMLGGDGDGYGGGYGYGDGYGGGYGD